MTKCEKNTIQYREGTVTYFPMNPKQFSSDLSSASVRAAFSWISLSGG